MLWCAHAFPDPFLNCVVCAEGLAGHLVILSVTSGGAAAQCRAAATPFSIAPGTTRSCVWAQGPGTSWGAAVAVGEGPPPGEGLAGKTGHACACLGASSRLRLWGQPGRAAVGQERAAQPEGHTAFQTIPQGASVWTCDAMNQPCVLLNVTEGGPRVWCSVPASRASAPAFGSLCVLARVRSRLSSLCPSGWRRAFEGLHSQAAVGLLPWRLWGLHIGGRAPGTL